MWLGPPLMNSQMTLFAFGAKCVGRGAIGLRVRSGAGLAATRPSSLRRLVKPSMPKPMPHCWSRARRERDRVEGWLGDRFTPALLWHKRLLDALSDQLGSTVMPPCSDERDEAAWPLRVSFFAYPDVGKRRQIYPGPRLL